VRSVSRSVIESKTFKVFRAEVKAAVSIFDMLTDLYTIRIYFEASSASSTVSASPSP